MVTPMSASTPRMRSASAKSFAFLAAARCAISLDLLCVRVDCVVALLNQIEHAGQLHEQIMRCGEEGTGRVLMCAVVGVDLAGRSKIAESASAVFRIVVHRVDELLLVAPSASSFSVSSAVMVSPEAFRCGIPCYCLPRTDGRAMPCSSQATPPVVKRRAVVRAQHEHADGLIAELLGGIAHHEEVALGLGHFLVVDGQEAVVQPVMREGAAVCALGLRSRSRGAGR